VSARKGREESLKAIDQRGVNETVMISVGGEVSARKGREGLKSVPHPGDTPAEPLCTQPGGLCVGEVSARKGREGLKSVRHPGDTPGFF
jgi:hypothetical protein